MNAWRDPPTLVGRHVTLRPLLPADRDALAAAAADQVDLFYANVSTFADPDAAMAAVFVERDHGRAISFAVCRPDGSVVGLTRFMRMNAGHRRLEIGGTVYAARVQRTGLNTEAKRLLLYHAFDVLGCQCVQFRTNWHNRASRAAIERLGARQDGVLRGHLVTPDGSIRDSVVYSILAHEWPQVRLNLDTQLARHA